MFYIARYPIADWDLGPSQVIFHHKRQPWESTAFAVELMNLPLRFIGREVYFSPAGAIGWGALERLWELTADGNLLVPLGADERRPRDAMGLRTLIGPRDIGLSFDAATLADVAWCVLARADREVAIPVLAFAAVNCEVLADQPQWTEDLIGLIGSPRVLKRERARLLARRPR